ncbi:MAG: helix-turn-helix transcriptional regulator [Planctomycetota bacterium]|nr:helix-turn-helix transcriptional regulator [Planctomycetota bacterium]
MDKIAPKGAEVFERAAGFPSERSRGLWWYVHNAAHQQCGTDWGTARERFFGHQIMFMAKGKGHGNFRGKAWTAAGGDAVLMDLRNPHTYHADPAEPWEMYWVLFDGPGVAEVFNALIRSAGSVVIPFASLERVRADFAALFRLLAEHPPGYDAWVWHHLSGLIANVVEGHRRAGGEADPSLAQAPAGVAAALAHLRFHHHRTLSLEELARHAHMSTFHFVRRFKRATGFTPIEYLEKYRIGRAQELMMTQPELRLNEIARAVGYDDPAYFSRVFRKRTGVSPRAYKQGLPGASHPAPA